MISPAYSDVCVSLFRSDMYRTWQERSFLFLLLKWDEKWVGMANVLKRMNENYLRCFLGENRSNIRKESIFYSSIIMSL